MQCSNYRSKEAVTISNYIIKKSTWYIQIFTMRIVTNIFIMIFLSYTVPSNST
ncbi:unnamed protein product [Meloidogyne enterolobii]|uniref:Uncharacterized protein n=1 Tax=Meloidogyne enterolobii TaxID=390850 RepID=A0ACB0XUH5_MELEN